MTQTAEITVAYVNQPRGNGPGSVKDTDGRYWQVWPDKLDEFMEGESYFVTYQTKMYQGKRQATIVSAVPMGGGTPPPAPRRVAPRPVPTVRPGPRFNGPSAPPNDERSEDISVLALAKSWLDKIPVGDVAGAVHVLRSCREAWRQYKNPNAAPDSFPGDDPMPESSEHEFDDKIPY